MLREIQKALMLGALVIAPCAMSAYTYQSPSGKTKVVTSVTKDGKPQYSVIHEGKTVISYAPLGLKTDFVDLSTGLKESGTRGEIVNYSYDQDKIKKSHVNVKAYRGKTHYTGANGKKLTVEWHVGDNDVAFRYLIPKQSGKGAAVIEEEDTGFKFPEGTTVYMTPQSDPMIGWKRTKPSYEEYYIVDAPLGTPSQYGHGFTFPALFHTPDGIWALVTETGVDGYYCASRLSDYGENGYQIAYPMPGENNGNGTSAPGMAIPGPTPWRTISLGKTLAPIVETTIPYDVVDPLYHTSRKAKPGKGTWSWILWQDGSINMKDTKKFIDLAAEMGYQNVLVDNWWDRNMGGRGIQELVAYGKERGVKPILWFSSSGHWNDIEQSPINLMDRPIVRKNTMRWLKENGIEMIKVDFFGGDKQETMRLYEDILSDAADHDIDVIFHGCTLPRGWERMYPNFVGAEAVLASENMIFEQSFCDKEALHATLHPFIRNSAAIMEYGGTFLNKRMSRDNKSGNIRRTTDLFQLALAVLFQNPVQNFALAPNNLTDAPKEALDFMREVPVEWDDVRYLDGEPGKYAVIARRSGNDWYIAGVSNLPEAKELKLKLPMLRGGQQIKVWSDGGADKVNVTNETLGKDQKVDIRLNPQSGFVIKASR